MAENKNNIGENTSSGAEKVKTIEKTVKKTPSDKETREKKNAAERVKRAKNKAELKDKKLSLKAERREKKLERKLAAKEKSAQRKAEIKEAAAKRKAEKAARKDLLKNESAVERLQRKEREKKARIEAKEKAAQRRHELALKKKETRLKKKEERLKDKQHKREQRSAAKIEHAPGFGGWLAAVISLGVVSMIMATVITAGAINMRDMNNGMASNYMGGVYELDGRADSIQNSLNKLRITTSSKEQSRLLTNILVQSELAENDLERMPIDETVSSSINEFVNRTRDFALGALGKLSSGEKLSDKEMQVINRLYSLNSRIRSELDDMTVNMTAKDISSWVKGKDGVISKGIGEIEKSFSDKGKKEDGHFMNNASRRKAKGVESYDEITSAEGGKKLFNMFSSYDLTESECTGETNVGGLECFNYKMSDSRGREFFVQLSKKGGKLVMFNSYEPCYAYNYDVEKCADIAEKFLIEQGFKGMKAVWSNECNSTAEINFAPEIDGTLIYPDMIKVKVCETRGIVTGVDAFSYWMNHTKRSIGQAELSSKEAIAKSGLDKTDITSSRLTLISGRGTERLAYEIYCSYEGEEYCVFVDASTGDEIDVFVVENGDCGRLLR